MFIEVLEFFSVLGFFKNDFSKKLLRIKTKWGLFGPPLGVAGVKSTVFYKTGKFDDTDITKYVLESQDLDLVPCQKSKSYLS